jgi:hypothetical protein
MLQDAAHNPNNRIAIGTLIHVKHAVIGNECAEEPVWAAPQKNEPQPLKQPGFDAGNVEELFRHVGVFFHLMCVRELAYAPTRWTRNETPKDKSGARASNGTPASFLQLASNNWVVPIRFGESGYVIGGSGDVVLSEHANDARIKLPRGQ